jgi:hypothetical protein
VSSDDIIKARQSLLSGTGQTTRRNKVLPFAPLIVQIPTRVGASGPRTGPAPIVTPGCLPSDFWQPTTFSGLPATFFGPTWHTATDTLYSSDGLFQVDRQAMKRLTFWAATPATNAPVVHVNFASATVAAANEPAAGVNDIQLLESSFASRTYHPMQDMFVYASSLVAAGYRLQTINLLQGAYAFSWTFKSDSDATSFTGSTPVCLNRNVSESDRAQRAWANDGSVQPRKRLTQLDMNNGTNTGKIKLRQAPWGILPAVTRADIALVNGVAGSESTINNCTDLAKIVSIGQPWHGFVRGTTLENPVGTTVTAASGGVTAPLYTHTRYFKSPYAPGTPAAPLRPPSYAANGWDFRDDVILKGGTHYDLKSFFGIGIHQWLHVDNSGVVRVLGLSLVSDTPTTTTWNVINYGPFRGYVDYATNLGVIGTIALVTTDAAACAVADSLLSPKVSTGSADYQRRDIVQAYGGGYVNFIVPRMGLSENWVVEARYDGRQIAVMRGQYNQIYTVATVDISASLTVSSPVDVFQWDSHGFLTYGYDYVKTRKNHFVGFIGSPSYSTWWYVYSEQSFFSMTPWYTVDCLGFAYDTAGALQLFTIRKDRDLSTIGPYDEGPTHMYDSGLPSPGPLPTTYPLVDGSVISVETETGTGITGANAQATVFSSPWSTPVTPYVFSSIAGVRMSNNCMVIRETWFASGTQTRDVVVTPTGRFGFTAVWTTSSNTNTYYCSWNPRTNQCVGRNNVSGYAPVSWI